MIKTVGGEPVGANGNSPMMMWNNTIRRGEWQFAHVEYASTPSFTHGQIPPINNIQLRV